MQPHMIDRLCAGKEGEDLVNTLLNNFDCLRSSNRSDKPKGSLGRVKNDNGFSCWVCGSDNIYISKENDEVCKQCGCVLRIHDLKLGAGVQVENYGKKVLIHQYKRLTRYREVTRQIQGLGEGFS